MDFKKIAVELLVKYVAPIVTKIIKSKIATIGKSLYEKLYNRIVDALKSFEGALEKMFQTKDPKKLQKRIVCCRLGLKFFEKIYSVLDSLIPEYAATITQAEEIYEKITGTTLEDEE